MSKLLFDHKDFFFAYALAASSYCGYFLLKQLLKEIKTYKMYQEVFGEKRREYVNQVPTNGRLALLDGVAKKIYERTNGIVDSDIIISKSNSWYIENFLLETNQQPYKSFFIQPNQKTLLFSLPRRYNNKVNMQNFWNRFLKFKSEIINSGDHICLVGKMITNKTDLVPYSENIVQIKPYQITELSLKDLRNECLTVFPILKTSAKLLAISLLIFFGIIHFKHSIQDYYNKRKTRAGILCHICHILPCNILCEKCENLTNYCSQCYEQLQPKINSNEIKLRDIKCVHCTNTLDVVQKLFT